MKLGSCLSTPCPLWQQLLYSKCSSSCLCHTKMQKWKRHVEEHPHFKQSTDLVNHAIHLVKLVYLCQIFQSEVSSTLCPLHSVFWTSCLACNLFYWFSVLQHVALKCIPCKKFTKIVYVFSYIFKIIAFITSCKMPTGWLLFRKMQWLPALNYIKPLSKLISSLVSKIQFSQIHTIIHFFEKNMSALCRTQFTMGVQNNVTARNFNVTIWACFQVCCSLGLWIDNCTNQTKPIKPFMYSCIYSAKTSIKRSKSSSLSSHHITSPALLRLWLVGTDIDWEIREIEPS